MKQKKIFEEAATAEKNSTTKEEGTVYISSTGSYYEEPEITAAKLKDFRDNIYGRGLSIKLKNLIFRDTYTLEVLDAKGEPDEDIQKRLTQICNSKYVRLWANMQRSFIDILWYGIGLSNPVWAYEGSEYVLQKLRHLPAYTFATMSIQNTEGVIYSQILQGITLDETKKEPVFWQTNEDLVQTQIKNIFYVKDPTAEGLAGESIILPLVPILEMLKFVWNTQIQQANRTGAKILFIKVTSPQPASAKNGNTGDVEYANLILQQWGKDQAFQLRENMELIDPGIRDDSSNLEIINALEHLLIDYIAPTSFIAREGSTIGGSEQQREELLNNYIEGIHGWLEDQYEMLLSRYLEYNEYKDYTVRINIPAPSIDRSELELRQATEGYKAKALTPNEIRERLGADDMTDEEIAALIELYNTKLAPPKPPAFEQAVMESLAALKKETPAKVERTLEEALEEAAQKLAADIIDVIEKEEE